MSGMNRADLADMFFEGFEKTFSGFECVCIKVGSENTWIITIDEKPDFRMRFAFEETEDGPTFAIKEIFPGRGNAEVLKRAVKLALDFYEPAGFTNLIIGSAAEDAAGRQRFVNALCAITPMLQPAENGYVRTLSS
jgi:hypothetical protein